ISDGDACTWGEYYGEFARRLGVTIREAPPGPLQPGLRLNPFRWLLAWCRGFGDIFASAECKALLKKALNTDPPGRLPRGLLESFPGLERWLRRRLGMDQPEIYRRPPLAEPSDLHRVRPRLGCVCIDKARKVLGYQPVVSREKALELTWEWVCHARVTR